MIFFYTFSNSSIRLTIILNTYIYEIYITSFKLYTYKVHIFALEDDCKSHSEIALDAILVWQRGVGEGSSTTSCFLTY